MHFIVAFATGNEDLLIERTANVGLDFIDRIRSVYPEFNYIDSKDIYVRDNCASISNICSLILTEERARETGKFSNTNLVKVIVPKGYLTRYVKYDVCEEVQETIVKPAVRKFGIVIKKAVREKGTQVTIKKNISDKHLWSDWKKSGFKSILGFNDYVCVWPDNTWCYIDDVEEYNWKSDDFKKVHLPEDIISEEEIDALVKVG